jgi:hypothetical protein
MPKNSSKKKKDKSPEIYKSSLKHPRTHSSSSSLTEEDPQQARYARADTQAQQENEPPSSPSTSDSDSEPDMDKICAAYGSQPKEDYSFDYRLVPHNKLIIVNGTAEHTIDGKRFYIYFDPAVLKAAGAHRDAFIQAVTRTLDKKTFGEPGIKGFEELFKIKPGIRTDARVWGVGIDDYKPSGHSAGTLLVFSEYTPHHDSKKEENRAKDSLRKTANDHYQHPSSSITDAETMQAMEEVLTK